MLTAAGCRDPRPVHRGLGEHDRRLDESFADREVEVGALHAFKCRANIAETEQVAEYDFGTLIAEGPTADVLASPEVRAAYLGDVRDETPA